MVDSINITDTDLYRHRDADSISACLSSLLTGSLDEEPSYPMPNVQWSTSLKYPQARLMGMDKMHFESSQKSKQISKIAHKASTGNKTSHQNNRFRPYQSEQWSARYHDLVEFRRERGHCLVPHKWKGNPELAQWVKRQRYQYKLKCLGRHSTLTDERLSCLNKMGFVWDSHRAAWQERFNELVAFRALHGNCNVHSGDEKYPQLAVWVKCQRRQYKRKIMTKDRFNKLQDLGFVWDHRKLALGRKEASS